MLSTASNGGQARRLNTEIGLVVDDDLDGREIARLLKGCGAVTRAASSAAKAIELLAAELPDVIVSDIGMLDEDGCSLVRRIRSCPNISEGAFPQSR